MVAFGSEGEMWRADRVGGVASVALSRGEASGDMPPVYPFELVFELRRVRELLLDRVRFRESTSSPGISAGVSSVSVVSTPDPGDSGLWEDSAGRRA